MFKGDGLPGLILLQSLKQFHKNFLGQIIFGNATRQMRANHFEHQRIEMRHQHSGGFLVLLAHPFQTGRHIEILFRHG